MKFLTSISEGKGFNSSDQESLLAMCMVKILEIRDQAHIFHLQTKSFAEHKALNEFYDELIALFDDLMESLMGTFDTIKIGGSAAITLRDWYEGGSRDLAMRTREVVQDLNAAVGEERGVQNIMDDIGTLADKIEYLLELK